MATTANWTGVRRTDGAGLGLGAGLAGGDGGGAVVRRTGETGGLDSMPSTFGTAVSIVCGVCILRENVFSSNFTGAFVCLGFGSAKVFSGVVLGGPGRDLGAAGVG